MSEHVVDNAKWQRLTIFEKMGNIGSEVGRAMNALRRGDEGSLTGAFYRGLDLIDATCGSLSAPRAKELLRARELFAEAVDRGAVDAKLEDYFMQYAIAARRGR